MEQHQSDEITDRARAIVDRYQGASYLYIDSMWDLPVGTMIELQIGEQKTRWVHRGYGHFSEPYIELGPMPTLWEPGAEAVD